jgi:hypothetical protein
MTFSITKQNCDTRHNIMLSVILLCYPHADCGGDLRTCDQASYAKIILRRMLVVL